MRYDLAHHWYQKQLTPFTLVLLPFSWLFGFVAALRRLLYQHGMLITQRFSVPVLVVGNITVGGTGKTPFIIWSANWLRSQGYRPGIVSRGVGGKSHSIPHQVSLSDEVTLVGDEALLLARHTNCPIVICSNRSAAINKLLQQSDCNLILSDDGLQHYRMGRNIEIILVDGARRFGNQRLLPAGPLREPMKRLAAADFVVTNGETADGYHMEIEPANVVSLKNSTAVKFTDFPRQRVHAIAGIGHPERFFKMLSKANFEIIPHVFPDHYHYQPQDLDFNDGLPIIMTEKDAVKCTRFAADHYWYVTITAKVDETLQQNLLAAILKKA